MKNFSATLDLGRFDCCAIRRGTDSVEYCFFFKPAGATEQIESSATKTYGGGLARLLFEPGQRWALREEAQKCLTIVQQQLLAHQNEIRDNETFRISNPKLES